MSPFLSTDTIFSQFSSWEYFFIIPHDCLTSELTGRFGATYQVDYKHNIETYFQNREKKVLAGAWYWWTESKSGPKKYPEVDLGPIVLLPLLKGIDSRLAINLLLEDIFKRPQATITPVWTDSIKMPFLENIEKQINKELQKIAKSRDKISELKKQKAELNYYKKLIYADGTELEDVFSKCLCKLGAKVNPAKYANEEYCLLYNKVEYPVEAKGNSKSVSLKNLRQLIDYLLIYDDNTRKRNKGILFGNAWKKLPLNQRNTHQKPIFPKNVIERAEANNVALVSSVDFFEAFCKFLNNRSLGKKILDCIVHSVGVVDFKNI